MAPSANPPGKIWTVSDRFSEPFVLSEQNKYDFSRYIVDSAEFRENKKYLLTHRQPLKISENYSCLPDIDEAAMYGDPLMFTSVILGNLRKKIEELDDTTQRVLCKQIMCLRVSEYEAGTTPKWIDDNWETRAEWIDKKWKELHTTAYKQREFVLTTLLPMLNSLRRYST